MDASGPQCRPHMVIADQYPDIDINNKGLPGTLFRVAIIPNLIGNTCTGISWQSKHKANVIALERNMGMVGKLMMVYVRVWFMEFWLAERVRNKV